jgi:hypothetical protein
MEADQARRANSCALTIVSPVTSLEGRSGPFDQATANGWFRRTSRHQSSGGWGGIEDTNGVPLPHKA